MSCESPVCLIVQLRDGVRQIEVALPIVPLFALVAADAIPAAPEETARAPHHSVDFSSISNGKDDYPLSPGQAAAVKVLWEAWASGDPDVRQETLLETAGSDGNRLHDLFRRNDIWGKLIVPGTGKGTFRLNLPPAASPVTG